MEILGSLKGSRRIGRSGGPASLESRLDEMLDLQMISIRLPKAMIEDYRYIVARRLK